MIEVVKNASRVAGNNLPAMISGAAGSGASFRSDLLYRLRGAVIHIPPLREGVEDRRPMALTFLSQFNSEKKQSAISSDALAALERFNRAGNVRGLKQRMARVWWRATGRSSASKIYPKSRRFHPRSISRPRIKPCPL